MSVEKQHRINQKILVPPGFINVVNQNISSSPVTFGISCTMIRHVIQAGIIVPVAVAGQQPRF